MSLTRNEIGLLVYLFEHCPSPNRAGALRLDRGWKNGEEATRTYAKELADTLHIGSEELEALATKLKESGWVGFDRNHRSLSLWITEAGIEKVTKDYKDEPSKSATLGADSANSEPDEVGIHNRNKATSPKMVNQSDVSEWKNEKEASDESFLTPRSGGEHSWAARYAKLTSWDKFTLWGSLASIVGFPLAVIGLLITITSTVGASHLFDRLIHQPVALLLLAVGVLGAGMLGYRAFRLFLFVFGLSHKDDASALLLMRMEYDRPVPESITQEGHRQLKRDKAVFILLLSLVATGVVGIILYFCYSVQALEAGRYQSEAHQMDQEVRQLLDKLKKQQTIIDSELANQRNALVIAAEAKGRATAIAHHFPGQLTQMHVEELGKLVKAIEGRVNVAQLSQESQLRVRLARATIANLTGQYQLALKLLNNVDQDAERMKTERRIEEEFRLIQTKADSFYGLHQWQDALKSFSRLVELKPTDVGARSGKGRCLFYLGRLQDSKRIWDELIVELTRSFKHGKTQEGRVIAASFANRAGVLADLGDLRAALLDLTVAVDMLKKVTKATPRSVPSDLVLTLIRRGGIQADVGNYDSALKDFHVAHLICEDRKANGQLATANELSSIVRHDKATVLFECGRINESLEELRGVIELQQQIVSNPSYVFLSDSLANSYLTRGTILAGVGRGSEAIADFNKTINIVQPLVSKHQRADLGSMLAVALRSRGSESIAQGNYQGAEADVLAATKMLRGLIKKENRFDLTAEMARTWIVSGHLLAELARRTEKSKRYWAKAEEIYSESIKLFEYLSKSVPKIQYKQGHAVALSSRSVARYRLGRRKEAKHDLELAYVLLLELASATNSAGIQLQLSECLIGLGVSLADVGDIQQGIKKVDKAINIQRQLTKDGNGTAQSHLASSLQIRGRMYAKKGNKKQALEDLDESILVCRSAMKSCQHSLDGLLSRSTRYRRFVAENKPIPDEP